MWSRDHEHKKVLAQLELAKQYQMQGQSAKAGPILTDLAQNPDVMGNPSLKARTELLQGTNLMEDADGQLLSASRNGLVFAEPSEQDVLCAVTYFQAAYDAFVSLNDVHGQTVSLEQLSSAYLALSDYRDAEKNLTKGLALSDQSAALSMRAGNATEAITTRLMRVDVICAVAQVKPDWLLLDTAKAAISAAERMGVSPGDPTLYSLLKHAQYAYETAEYERTGEAKYLERALRRASEAVAALSPEGNPHLQAAALYDKATALDSLGYARDKPELELEAAEVMIRARELTDPRVSPISAAQCDYQIGSMYQLGAEGPAELKKSIAHYEAAEAVLTRATSPLHYARINEELAWSHVLLATYENPRQHLAAARARLETASGIYQDGPDVQARADVRDSLNMVRWYSSMTNTQLRRWMRKQRALGRD